MISLDDTAEELIDVLFFEGGDTLSGADASQVVRIDRPLPEDPVLPELGPLRRGNRVLVFDTPEGEGHLRVDGIRGVRPVSLQSLRRLPPVVAAAPYAIGVYLDEARPILLIDLLGTTTSSEGRH